MYKGPTIKDGISKFWIRKTLNVETKFVCAKTAEYGNGMGRVKERKK